MSATIFLHEFRIRLRSVLIWSLSVSAMIFFFFTIFQGFASQAVLLNQVMSRFPPALLEIFGLGRVNMATVLGFYSMIFTFVQLCLAIQAGNYGFGLVSVEENELTADFLLTKPVSRPLVLTSKLLGAIAALTVTNAVVWGVTFLTIATHRGTYTYDAGILILLLVSIVFFQLFFLSVGLVISLLVKRVRSVTPYSMGLGFGMYVLSAFIGMFGTNTLEYITPFKHFDPAYIVLNGKLDLPLVLIDVAVSLVAVGFSYWLYIRRDIHAVS